MLSTLLTLLLHPLKAADVYSFGVIMWDIFHGKIAWQVGVDVVWKIVRLKWPL